MQSNDTKDVIIILNLDNTTFVKTYKTVIVNFFLKVMAALFFFFSSYFLQNESNVHNPFNHLAHIAPRSLYVFVGG